MSIDTGACIEKHVSCVIRTRPPTWAPGRPATGAMAAVGAQHRSPPRSLVSAPHLSTAAALQRQQQGRTNRSREQRTATPSQPLRSRGLPSSERPPGPSALRTPVQHLQPSRKPLTTRVWQASPTLASSARPARCRAARPTGPPPPWSAPSAPCPSWTLPTMVPMPPTTPGAAAAPATQRPSRPSRPAAAAAAASRRGRR